MSIIVWCMSIIAWHMSIIMWHMLIVMCSVSLVAWRVSIITCCMSCKVIFKATAYTDIFRSLYTCYKKNVKFKESGKQINRMTSSLDGITFLDDSFSLSLSLSCSLAHYEQDRPLLRTCLIHYVCPFGPKEFLKQTTSLAKQPFFLNFLVTLHSGVHVR